MIFMKFGKYRMIILISFVIFLLCLIKFFGIFELIGYHFLSFGGYVRPFEARDDGSHYESFQGYPNIQDLHEWWYANFYDKNSSLSGLMMLVVMGDLKSFKHIISLRLTVLNHSESLVEMGEIIPIDQYSWSKYESDIVLGESRIEMLDSNTYWVYIKSKNENIELNLTYKRVTPGFSKRDSFFGEKVFWIVPLPLAKVEGFLVYNEKKIYINGKGYHDHNYGFLTGHKWDWAEVGDLDNNLGIVFTKANIENKTIGSIIVIDDKKIITQISYPHADVEYIETIEKNGRKFPTKLHIYGEKDRYVVDLYVNAVGNDLLIYTFTGNVTKNNEVLYSIQNEIGFLVASYDINL